MILRNILEDYWREIHRKAGYEENQDPHHAQPRPVGTQPATGIITRKTCTPPRSTTTDFAIKPMNCPGGILVYKRRLWSYRDLPIRSGELGLVHRHESRRAARTDARALLHPG